MIAQVIAVLFVGGFGVTSTYVDLSSNLARRGVVHAPIIRSPWAGMFMAFNGLASIAFLTWSFSSTDESGINAVVPTTSLLARTFIFGFGVPLLIRSKAFSFGGASEYAAGPAALYDFFYLRVLLAINSAAYRLLLVHVRTHSRDALTVTTDRWESFIDMVGSEEKRAVRHEQLDRIVKETVDSVRAEQLISWAIGICGFDEFPNLLKEMKA